MDTSVSPRHMLDKIDQVTTLTGCVLRWGDTGGGRESKHMRVRMDVNSVMWHEDVLATLRRIGKL